VTDLLVILSGIPLSLFQKFQGKAPKMLCNKEDLKRLEVFVKFTLLLAQRSASQAAVVVVCEGRHLSRIP
jgi:hypothetical protein